MLTVSITGIDKFIASISKIPAIAQKNMRVAMNKGLDEVQKYSSNNHKYKRRSGNADRAYKKTVDTTRMEGTLALDQAVSKAPYIFALHEGSKPHKIYPRNKKHLLFVKAGKFYNEGKKGYVNHPGTQPDKFLYQALEVKRPVIMGLLNDAMAKTIKEAGY